MLKLVAMNVGACAQVLTLSGFWGKQNKNLELPQDMRL